MKWEYRFVQVQPGWDHSEQAPSVPFDLEDAGRQGWEAVGIVPAKVAEIGGYSSERPVFVVLLKRPAPG
jgi:hypothetical protein